MTFFRYFCLFFFTVTVPLLCGASKGFMKAINAFIKPFETPQRNLKIKISVNFYFDKSFLNPDVGRVNRDVVTIKPII